MLRRYIVGADSGSTPAPPSGVQFAYWQELYDNSTTRSEKTFINGGPANGTVTFKCTALSKSNPSVQYLNVVGVGNLNLNQTFTLNLDSSGEVQFTTIAYAGTVGPGGITGQLQIISVSSGSISPTQYSRYYSKNI